MIGWKNGAKFKLFDHPPPINKDEWWPAESSNYIFRVTFPFLQGKCYKIVEQKMAGKSVSFTMLSPKNWVCSNIKQSIF